MYFNLLTMRDGKILPSQYYKLLDFFPNLAEDLLTKQFLPIGACMIVCRNIYILKHTYFHN